MIIVTGATGFIGSAFVWELNQAGHKDILCVDQFSPAEVKYNYLANREFTEFVRADEIWDALHKYGSKIQWIVHLGACSSTTEMDRDYLYQNNVMYSIRLWQWCKENGARFIYASSAATYGAGELDFSDQTDSEQLQPLNPYGESKVVFDRWAKRQISAPENWYGLKFFNVYGPNENHKEFQASVHFKAFSEIRSNRKLKLFRSHRSEYKDGHQTRDFVYVKDVTRWIRELMEKLPPSDIYNMGFGTERTWLDLARASFRALNVPMEIEWTDIPELIRDKYQYRSKAEMTKLLSVGLSEPQWPLEKAIDDYYKNYLSQDRYL